MKTRSTTEGGQKRTPRWVTGVVIVLLALVAALGVDIVRGAMAEDLVPWRTDVQQALAEASAANRPVLLYFTADWCGPCQQMRRDVYSDEQVAGQIEASALPVKVDLTDPLPGTIEHDLATQMQVMGVPTLVLLRDAGERSRVSGYVDADELLGWLARHAG